uniref:Uncharacterized protein n=1 Tax=Meloidogyne javanica TaxID=6303 RepID=A0A915MRH8_MELJA
SYTEDNADSGAEQKMVPAFWRCLIAAELVIILAETIWAGKLRLTPFAEFCSADFSYSHGFSIQPIPEMDEFIVYTNKVF